MRHVTALFLGLTVLAHATLAQAEEGTLQEVGYGVASVLATLIYVPFKTATCIAGGMGSGPVWIYDRATAGSTVETTCGGTWVITPAVMKGRDQFQVLGDAA